jgi:hypothetical protein
MTVNNSDNEQQSVMLAADVSSYSISTVNLAVAMAASTNTLLRCLFIEDEDLLQVTALPCSREITLTTARERPTSIDQMQRSLRSVAQQFRKTLQQEAHALQITWSFDTVRGRVRDISLKTKSDVTYTILGQSMSHRQHFRRVHGSRKILIVGNDSSYRKHALEMLLHRFAHQKIEVTFVASNTESEISAELAQQLKTNDKEIVLIELNRNQLDDLLAQTTSSFDCAIISKHGQAEETLQILKKLLCPVILVA